MPVGMATASTERISLFRRWFGARRVVLTALYTSIIDEARQRYWYADCAVPDTVDGRFDMLTLVLSLVLLRLEAANRADEAVWLTERFVEDMDGQIRESGFGDLVVGKQVGGIMALLGGRLGVYRTDADAATLERTLWRGNAPDQSIIDTTIDRIRDLRAQIEAVPIPALLSGRIR